MWAILKFLPLNHLSFLLGRLAWLQLPRCLGNFSVRIFARLFRIDLSEASLPLESYESIGHFFARDLKENARPLPHDFARQLLSPVDGVLRDCGQIKNGTIEQIKGKNYSVKELLAGDEWSERFTQATYLNLYLAPPDYHHVHAPLTGKIVKASYIPGYLWPVNDWSLQHIDNLFSVNERLVTYMQHSSGMLALVMVGATNVGRLEVVYDSFPPRPLCGAVPNKAIVRHYADPLELQAGVRLGSFHLGSTVLLLCEPGFQFDRMPSQMPTKVRCRAGLARIVST